MIWANMIFLLAALLVVPTLIGTIFRPLWKERNVFFCWAGGQVLLWAAFQVLCVPVILFGKSFLLLASCYLLVTGALLFFALGSYFKRRSNGTPGFHFPKLSAKNRKKVREGGFFFWWVLAVVLLAVQLILAVVLSYEEGDDAYYVSISTASTWAEKLYTTLPYTGGYSGLNARHALAPFPVWISFLSRVSGVEPVTVAHTVLPLCLILASYGIFSLLGKKLLGDKQKYLPIFLVFVEFLILYGGYSLYSSENFLLVRSAQGKAVLCNIIIPFLTLLMYLLLESLEKGEKKPIGFWVLVYATMAAGCLCSTLGTFLLCMLAGLVTLCGVFVYKKFRFAFWMAGSMLAPLCFAVIYFLMD